MRKSDWPKFVKLIEGADQVTAGQERTEEGLSFMFTALSDYPYETIFRAVMSCAKKSRFHPQLAEIIQEIDGDISDKSLIAWRIFLRAMERHGFWGSVRFPDPAYHYAIDMMGGWMRICESWHTLTDKELEFRGKEWRKLYEAGLSRASWDGKGGTVMIPSYFPGYHEWNNKAAGYLEFVPPVIEIGSGAIVAQEMLGSGNKVPVSALSDGKGGLDGQRETEETGIGTENKKRAIGRGREGPLSISEIQFQTGIEREEN